MAYRRTGGSGRKGSLRTQFNYYKRQVTKRLIDEQAFIEARGGFSFSGKPPVLFENLDYDELMTKGTSRLVKGKTVYYKGEEAVKLQIESLRARASKNTQTDLFIKNYLQALERIEMPYNYIHDIETAFFNISNDKLAILIDKNILPQIAYVYADLKNDDELYATIMNALQKGVTNEEVKEINAQKAKLKPYITKKFEILGWNL